MTSTLDEQIGPMDEQYRKEICGMINDDNFGKHLLWDKILMILAAVEPLLSAEQAAAIRAAYYRGIYLEDKVCESETNATADDPLLNSKDIATALRLQVQSARSYRGPDLYSPRISWEAAATAADMIESLQNRAKELETATYNSLRAVFHAQKEITSFRDRVETLEQVVGNLPDGWSEDILRLCDAIEAADARCLAVDGPCPPTVDAMSYKNIQDCLTLIWNIKNAAVANSNLKKESLTTMREKRYCSACDRGIGFWEAQDESPCSCEKAMTNGPHDAGVYGDVENHLTTWDFPDAARDAICRVNARGRWLEAERERLRKECDAYKAMVATLEACVSDAKDSLNRSSNTMESAIAEIERLRDRVKELEVVGRLPWVPASEHPKEFEDGDAYIVAVPVQSRRTDDSIRHHTEIHVIRVSCDEDYFCVRDADGNDWGWVWDDVSHYIRLTNQMLPTTAAAKAGG